MTEPFFVINTLSSTKNAPKGFILFGLLSITADPKSIQQAIREYKNALHFYPDEASGWNPRVTTSSALTGKGIPEIWELIREYISLTKENGYFQTKRNRQAKYWMYDTIERQLNSYWNCILKTFNNDLANKGRG